MLFCAVSAVSEAWKGLQLCSHLVSLWLGLTTARQRAQTERSSQAFPPDRYAQTRQSVPSMIHSSRLWIGPSLQNISITIKGFGRALHLSLLATKPFGCDDELAEPDSL